MRFAWDMEENGGKNRLISCDLSWEEAIAKGRNKNPLSRSHGKPLLPADLLLLQKPVVRKFDSFQFVPGRQVQQRVCI